MNPPARVTASYRFALPPARVYEAWLDPAWIGRWMFGPDDRIVRLGLEPRVGGRFSFVINRGGREINHTGRYLELDGPHLLVFTWSTRDAGCDASRIIVEISPLGDGCELTLTHVAPADRAGFPVPFATSWHRRLGALARVLTPETSLVLHPL
jgi:uncharacterized protein YndB with AHSA1/START domain